MIELATIGETPYIETLKDAIEWRRIKKEKNRVTRKPSVLILESQKEEIRKRKPKKRLTKEVELSSGSKFIIKKPTSLEWLEIWRKIKSKLSDAESTLSQDLDLKEAVKKLTRSI